MNLFHERKIRFKPNHMNNLASKIFMLTK